MITNANRSITNQEIRTNNNIEDIKINIDEITTKFYQENLRHIPIQNSIALYNKETVPFKLKHILPYHILMEPTKHNTFTNLKHMYRLSVPKHKNMYKLILRYKIRK